VIQVAVGSDTISVDWSPAPSAWDPSQLGFTSRPIGDGYVAIETLGVTLDGVGLRKAAADPRANGKILTLPPGLFSLDDYAQGTGTFMFGLMVNPDVGGSHIRGIVGSGAGTILQMTPNSSHFTKATVQGSGSAPVQVATVMFYKGIDDVEFANLVVQGQPQGNPSHYHHGIRILGHGHVHHVKFIGANQGDSNSPPGETYSLEAPYSLVEDIEIDGRRSPTAAPTATSVIAFNGGSSVTLNRVWAHDLISGFGVVAWNSMGVTLNDLWVDRPGTGTGGKAGSAINFELSGGPIRVNRLHVNLDEAWTNPAWGSPPKADPKKPAARNQGHFPHVLFLQTPNGSAQTKTNAWADVTITDPVFDPWGGVGGFAIAMDNISLAQGNFPKVIVGGVTLTPVVRPTLWVDNAGFDPKKNYWVGNASVPPANPGAASVWG
jgi:hypothetical protein